MTKKEMEHAIGNHAEWIEHLAGRMDELAAAQLKTQAQIEDTNKSLRELGQGTDKRIADLVSAIGRLVTKLEPPQ
jgi:predicted  nucleic acid-binding Zn-ribbon protein